MNRNQTIKNSSKFASENKKTIDKNLLCYTLPPAQKAKAVSARSIPRSPTASARPARGSARWAESATTCLHSLLSRPMAQLASLEPVRPPAAVGWDRTVAERSCEGGCGEVRTWFDFDLSVMASATWRSLRNCSVLLSHYFMRSDGFENTTVVFSFMISFQKFSLTHITSNLTIHAWSIKYS